MTFRESDESHRERKREREREKEVEEAFSEIQDVLCMKNQHI